MWKLSVCCLLLAITAVAAKDLKTRHIFRQPDTLLWPNDNDEFENFENHPCRRTCIFGISMRCYYKLYIHEYQIMGNECSRCLSDPDACEAENCIYADGVPTQLKLVNHHFPGPNIEVCKGDVLVVDFVNRLHENMTIHWHGLNQMKTPESDGVPHVTQQPIQPMETLRVCTEADEDGSEWYHSHMYWQRAEGIYGGLIIRANAVKNPHAALYQVDKHALVIQDHFYDGEFNGAPSNILINGKGRNHFSADLDDNHASHRYERLFVTFGLDYRIRIIFNGISNCPLEISVQNHRFTVIAVDGNDIESQEADKLQLTSAERMDIVLHANKLPGVYWIRVTGLVDCAGLYQNIILHYNDIPKSRMPSEPMSAVALAAQSRSTQPLVNINALMQYAAPNDAQPNERDTVIGTSNIPTLGLKSLYPMVCPGNTEFRKFYFSFGLYRDGSQARLQMDNITFEDPSFSMLQDRHWVNDDLEFCNRTSLRESGRDCATSHCQCTNVVRMPLDECIEIIVVNYMATTHPWHGHGHTFRLVGQGVLGNIDDLRNIEEIDRQGGLNRLPDDYPAVEKDTVQVPPMGYIVMRVKTNNPGYWIMHCHIERHALLGMAAVMKVGEDDDMKDVSSTAQCVDI